MDDDIRDSISEVFNEMAPETPAADAPKTPETPAAPEASATPATPAPAPAASPAPAAPTPAPGAPEAPTTPAPTDAAQTPAPESPAPNSKAPGSWTPAAREKWPTVDPEIREEIWRREREGQRALQVSTEARRHVEEFNRTMQPFLGFIAAENGTPMKAVENMMQTAAALRVGSPQQKVQIIADAIRNFGVDLRALDSVLAGQQPEFNPQVAIDQAIQRHTAPLQQQLQQYQQYFQQQDSAIQTQASRELEEFSKTHEFFEDVRPLIADLMQASMQRGEPMGLTQAYEAAILIYEPVRRVVEARKQQQNQQQLHQQAQVARGAAVSVTPSRIAEQVKPTAPDDMRAAIEAAIANTGGR